MLSSKQFARRNRRATEAISLFSFATALIDHPATEDNKARRRR